MRYFISRCGKIAFKIPPSGELHCFNMGTDRVGSFANASCEKASTVFFMGILLTQREVTAPAFFLWMENYWKFLESMFEKPIQPTSNLL